MGILVLRGNFPTHEGSCSIGVIVMRLDCKVVLGVVNGGGGDLHWGSCFFCSQLTCPRGSCLRGSCPYSGPYSGISSTTGYPHSLFRLPSLGPFHHH